MRLIFLVLTVFFFAGCATAGPSVDPKRSLGKPTEADRRAIAQIRTHAEALLQRQAELFWQAWTTGARVDVAALYAEHERIFTADMLWSLHRVRNAEKNAEAKRALRALENWLAGEILARATAEESARLAMLEDGATFTVDGAAHGWRELEPMLAAEADPARRAAIQEAALPVLQRLGEVIAARRARLEEAAKANGYTSALHAAAALRGSDPQAIHALSASVLDATAPLYDQAFGSMARTQLGLDLAELRRADVPRLFAGPGFIPRFPESGAQAAFESTVRSLGLDPAAIRVETKSPMGRPLAFAVAPPTDVRLVLPPATRDWAPLFHEAGAAVHAAHMRPGPFEHTLLGNEASAEAFATLFENLTTDTAWLRAHTGKTAAEASAHAAASAVERLYLARRHAGRLAFQVGWANGAADPRALYRVTMERAYRFPLTEADTAWYAVDQDEWLFAADALRAWILAAMLEEHLVGKYGAEWWKSAEAGQELVALWARGNRDTPDEIARKLGASGLDPQALVRQLQGRLAAILPAPQPAATEPPHSA